MAVRPLQTLSLCTGAAGLELGLNEALRRLGAPASRTVCAVEGEAYAAANLVALMEAGALDQAPIWSDVRTFSAVPWRGRVDCVTGGYPCQPFSVAGQGKGTADPRHLWPHFARIIAECEPALCVLENVANHLGHGFDEVAGDLQEMGFNVAATLWTAQEAGAPHRRERLFILAAHPDRCSLRQLTERPTPGRDDVLPGGQADPADHGAERHMADADGARPQERAWPGFSSAKLTQPTGGCLAGRAPRWARGEAVADTNGELGDERRESDTQQGARGRYADRGPERPDGMGDTDSEGQLRPAATVEPEGGVWACDASWWAAEPAVGGRPDGVAAQLDSRSNEGKVDSCTQTTIAQVVRILCEDVHTQTLLERTTRGCQRVQAEEVLFAAVCWCQGNGRFPREQLSSAPTPEDFLRFVWGNKTTDSAPHSSEHTDALRLMSHMVASRGQTPWNNPLWEGYLPRTTANCPAWVDQLRLLGNGVVPAQAAGAIVELWTALQDNEPEPNEGLTP